jgi:DNA-binding MarR family transcriptional regulator
VPVDGDRESIGFLVGALLRRKRLAFRTLLAPFQVTPRQYAVLSRLWQQDCLTLTELARRLYADPSSLCRTIVLMERSGLVQRQRDQQDRRIFRIKLSKRGRALKRRLQRLVRTHEKETVRGLSPAEVKVVSGAMRKMLGNLGGAPAGGVVLEEDDA